MQLHELVEFKNLILKYLNSDSLFDTSEFDSMTKRINLVSQLNFTNEINNVNNSTQEIFAQYDRSKQTMTALIHSIDQRINELTKDYFKFGYITINGLGVSQMPAKDERSLRDRVVNHEVKEKILSVIFRSTSDDYPAMEIGPGDGIWTDYLVAADPLYIVDRNQEFLDTTKAKYSELYQRRLRFYKPGNGLLPDSDFSLLPQNQFRFIFAWNVFNYFPLDYTQSFLQSCFNMLRPGGNMFFSYNNCEDPLCAKFAESGYASWMPKAMLEKTVSDLGFNIHQTGGASGWHWIEIIKPGTLSTVKVHQSLGEIVRY